MYPHNKNHNAIFPDLPSYSAQWTPIFWEPILLSGEKITAIISAVGNDGQILIEPVLRQNVIKTLFPNGHRGAAEMLNWAVESLTAHLCNGGDVLDWSSPMSGFTLGTPRQISSYNIESVIQQAIPLCASLSCIGIESYSKSTTATVMSNDRWRSSIKEEVVRRLPRLESSFRREYTIKKGARSTIIDFVGQKTASNFSRLSSNGLSRCVKDAKAQILDLAALRDDLNLFSGEEQYQLIVWRPDEAMKESLSKNQLNSITEAFLELEGEGDRFDLRVRGHFTPTTAAESICKIELAV